MAFTEDLTVFLDQDGFADPVVFTSGAMPAAYAPKTCNGIFDATFTDGQVGNTNLEAMQPSVVVREVDVPGVVRGDFALVKGRTYSVMQLRPDGTGIVTVLLADE